MEHKLKILFQEPFVPKNITYGMFAAGAGNNTFPFGVASIAAYIAQRGYDPEYLDPQIEGMSEEKYIEYLKQNTPDVVAMGSTTPQIKYTIQCFELIKRFFPDIVTVLGGIHATETPEETLNSTGSIDYMVLGEGEKTFYQLAEKLSMGQLQEIGSLSGVAFKSSGRVIVNPFNEEDRLPEEELPTPLFEIFPMDKYVAQVTYAKTFPTYGLLASRGCPYDCVFCDSHVTTGKKTRYKPVETVIEEIRVLKDKYGARGMMFFDDTFTVNRQWVEDFCEQYSDSGIALPWACNSRVDTSDAGLLKTMKDAGCWCILFGVESANQKSLDMLKKGTTVRQNEKTLRVALELGYYVYTSYILGLPGEDEEDVCNTIRFAKRIGNQLSLFFLPVPMPGTELQKIAKADGGLREDAKYEDYNQFDFADPVYVNPLLGREKMKGLLKKAFIEFYMTPAVILRNLKELILLKQSPYKFWQGLKGVAGITKL
ncbi:MAG: radical SAM protein [Candidatus Tantalella remota]|nr:radical SAM protein [Candidatus Tantalella remota]